MSRTVVYVAGAAFFSGAERALLVLLQHMDRSRYDPFVIVGNDGEMRAQLEASQIPCEYVPLRYTGWRDATAWLTCVARIAGILRRTKASLVHANEAPSFQPAGYAARLLGVPAISHIRFPDTHEGFAWFLKPAFARAVFVSKYLLTDADQGSPGLFTGRAEAIYDGVLPCRIPSAAERAAGRASLGLSQDPAVVLAGQVSEIKGVWEYIEAARQLIEAGVRCTFVVLGDDLKGQGAFRRQAEARVQTLGLTQHFRFLGFRRDAPALIPLFDISAVPSHVEPLGNATLEAMSAGLPVVGARVGGIPEMIDEGVTGFLVPPKDATALAAALRRLVEDPALRHQLGSAGRARAATAFGMERCVTNICALYDAVVSPRV